MSRHALPCALALALLAAAAPEPTRAARSYDNCTGFVTSLPATITSQGNWCMDRDLPTSIASGAAITIATNNVTLDCNDFKLGGLGAGPGTQTYGVRALNRSNIVVRNCNVRGFRIGIGLDYGSGHLVEENRLDANTAIGIGVLGDDSLIRGNRISDTGGTLSYTNVTGIFSSGNVDIVGNIVSDTRASSDGEIDVAEGIYISDNDGGRVEGNTVRGVYLTDGSAGVGISMLIADSVWVNRNMLSSTAATGEPAIDCRQSVALVSDNFLAGHSAGMQGCVDAGGNLRP